MMPVPCCPWPLGLLTRVFALSVPGYPEALRGRAKEVRLVHALIRFSEKSHLCFDSEF